MTDAHRARRRRRLLALGSPFALFGLAGAVIPLFTSGPPIERRPVQSIAPIGPIADAELRVMSLNLAHGRRDGLNQIFQPAYRIRTHLFAVGDLLTRERPHLVGLQEADGPSRWSGAFDHVETVARRGGMARFARAENVRGPGLAYGAALMARGPMRSAMAYTFAPSWPTFTKGFIVATVDWDRVPGGQLDVVSVHLDFASSAVRARQVEAMVAALRDRGRPMIVMGDFNCDWRHAGCPLRVLADGLDLHPAGVDDDRPTFPSHGRHLDWILASEGLAFTGYDVVPDTVSDHQAIVARIRPIASGLATAADR